MFSKESSHQLWIMSAPNIKWWRAEIDIFMRGFHNSVIQGKSHSSKVSSTEVFFIVLNVSLIFWQLHLYLLWFHNFQFQNFYEIFCLTCFQSLTKYHLKFVSLSLFLLPFSYYFPNLLPYFPILQLILLQRESMFQRNLGPEKTKLSTFPFCQWSVNSLSVQSRCHHKGLILEWSNLAKLRDKRLKINDTYVSVKDINFNILNQL